MSDYAARAALERMNMREVAIAPHYTGLVSDLRHLADSDPESAQAAFEARSAELCAAYGFSPSEARKPFAFANGLAIIPVHGTLINRYSWSDGYVTGYSFLRAQFRAALADDDVSGIIFDINSYGGEASGCFELSDEIYAARGVKPTIGVIDSNCYSGAYMLGSAMGNLVVTPSGGVGSIGVVVVHMDMSGMLEKWGIVVTMIHAGEHKVDGNPYMALPESVRDELQTGCEKTRMQFAELVARNRGIETQAVLDTEARIYRADAALQLGLIDAIAPPSEAVQAFFSGLTGSTTQLTKEDSMSTEDQKPDQVDTAKLSAEARVAERARVSSIMNCEEAKGREKLANHLAFETDMSVDAAKSILGASEVVAAKPEQASPAANGFEAAMNADQHPQVGADGTAGGPGELSMAAQILQAQSAVTGITYK